MWIFIMFFEVLNHFVVQLFRKEILMIRPLVHILFRFEFHTSFPLIIEIVIV
jgi:hypothetical protein